MDQFYTPLCSMIKRDRFLHILHFLHFSDNRNEIDKMDRNYDRLNEELHNLYCSPSIIRIIRSRRMRWAGHVAWMGEKMHTYRILVESRKERDH
jgi:hypothetical protein